MALVVTEESFGDESSSTFQLRREIQEAKEGFLAQVKLRLVKLASEKWCCMPFHLQERQLCFSWFNHEDHIFPYCAMDMFLNDT